MAENVAAVKTESGLFDSLKDTLNPSNIMRKLNLTPHKLMEMGIYFGAGFLAGYLLKKYGKFMIVLILGVFILLFLQQLGIISVIFHSDKFQELFGIQPALAPEGNILLLYWEWVKANVMLVLSFSIGFLVGLRVG